VHEVDLVSLCGMVKAESTSSPQAGSYISIVVETPLHVGTHE